ncbi:tetratricopeptide repeat-containing sensor histidine kinase [Pontibacter harenae]|uniref:tetratricopeptide repeat-containing sensor histidine kinase n=1 Tax=Pontibacter harenae TaxID=2894083 RepID=UPI001E5CDD65|nr:tetratricopeptide repeat-containing sensor histidine kinase [Pontibacter harenae]MCC9166272.1 tetratricopeptide repeat-containing sensor histidine kinase [Pontibacter harenae]
MRFTLSVIFCLIALVLSLEPAHAQFGTEKAVEPDSKAHKSVDSLNELAFEVKRHDVEQALSLLNEASRLAVSSGYKKGEAINYLYEAGIYQQFGYDRKALPLFYKSLDLSKQINDTFNIARANQQIGNALIEANDFTEAEKVFKEAMKNYVVLKKRDDIVNTKNSLGLIKLEQEELLSAERYFTEALKESEQINYGYGLKKSNYNLGLLYLQADDLTRSKVYFTASLMYDIQKNDKYGLSLTKNKLSLIAARKGNYSEAIELAEASLNDAKAVSANQLIVDAIENAASVYALQGNYVRVAELQKKLISQQQQVMEQERDSALDFIDMLRQKQEEQLVFEKHALQAEQKARLTSFMLLIVGAALLVLSGLAYMWYRNYRKAELYSKELSSKNELIALNALELRELNEAVSKQNMSLEETNEMKDKLFSIISHDLRTPFSSVKSILQLVHNRKLSETDLMRYLDLVNKEMDVMMDMLNNLLVWSKAQLKGSSVDLKPLNLHQLTAETVKFAARQAEQKSISLVNTVPENALAYADKERVNFVLRNLLLNAIKFTYENGEVKISLEEAGENISIAVTDNGKGMSKENVAKLFTKQRFTSVGTAKEKGTGLGLMLSKDLINSMQGAITVESEEGKGSTFYVTLPKASLDTMYEADMLVEVN